MSQPPFEALAAAFERNQTFYIATHVGPDGDAIGSALALKAALEARGKTVYYVSRDGAPQSTRFLAATDEVLEDVPDNFVPDCAIVLDCDGTPARVAARYEPIQNARERILIDHHRSAQPIFDINWLDPDKAATAQMVYELLMALEMPISADMAQGLMTGLSCDTGHFRFTNTSPEVLSAASYLVERGADPARVAFALFDERSFSSTQLLGIALTKMQTAKEGQIVYTALAQRDFLSIGTGDESSENVVNYLRNIKGARFSLIFRERRDDSGLHARISVRSEAALRADLFCNEFGGGGHAVAAGCRQTGNFDVIVDKVVRRAIAWLDEEHPPLTNVI